MQLGRRFKLKQAMAPMRSAFVVVGLFSLFINLSLLTVPLYMIQVYDRVLTSQSRDTLLMLTLLAIGMLGVMAALEIARSRLLVRIGADIDHRLSKRLFTGAFVANSARGGANAGQPLQDLDTLRTFLTGAGILAFFDAPWVPIYLAITFLLHPLIGTIAVGGALTILTLALISEFVTRKPMAASGTASRNSKALVDVFSRNSESVRVMGMLDGVRQRWFANHQTGVAHQAAASDRIGIVQGVTKFSRMGLQVAILGTGAWLVLEGSMSAGSIVAASIIMGRGLAPVEAAIGHWRGFVGARAAYQRLDVALDALDREEEDVLSLPAPEGCLTVNSLGFRLPGDDAPILHGVSFGLEPGEQLGIIGPSGAGKSSLARLIVGSLPPCLGSIRLDGAKISDWPHREVGRYLGYLPQDIEVPSGSIAENISRFGELDSDAVVAAAKLVGAHDMILKLRDGYQTEVGEGGRNLSGGQLQRIGLARAVYGDARLIVLDEPNANLDAEGETALRHALSVLRKQRRSVVIVTHKPSLLAHADKLLVLRDGQVEMFGEREKVMAQLRRNVVTKPVAARSAEERDGPKEVADGA